MNVHGEVLSLIMLCCSQESWRTTCYCGRGWQGSPRWWHKGNLPYGNSPQVLPLLGIRGHPVWEGRVLFEVVPWDRSLQQGCFTRSEKRSYTCTWNQYQEYLTHTFTVNLAIMRLFSSYSISSGGGKGGLLWPIPNPLKNNLKTIHPCSYNFQNETLVCLCMLL